jgi:DNA-binding MarR family transcriptional regulator
MRRQAATGRDQADPLGHDLGWMVGVVFRAYVRAAGRALGDLPGGPRGYQVLTAAVRGESANQGAIAEELGIDRTVLTYLIDDLERLGLVARRPDPADRRSRLVVATEEGHGVWERQRQALSHVESRLLGTLAADEADTFRALLRRLACAAQALDPVGSLCEFVQQVGTDADAGRAGGRRVRRGG